MSKLKLNVSFYDGKNVSIEVNSTDTWKNVKQALKSSIDATPDQLVLLLSSALCKDDDLLMDSSVTENSDIQCFIDKGVANPDVKLKHNDLMELETNLFRVCGESNFEDFILKLKSIDKLSYLIGECPALIDDPECLATVLDPTVLTRLVYDAGFYKLIDDKPVLGRLLQTICALAKKEESTPRSSNAGSYALDELSDDDDDDMDTDQVENAGNSRRPNSRVRASDFMPITPAQLAAALANATGSSSSQNTQSSSAPRSGLPTPPSTSTPFNTPGLASASVTGGASPGAAAAIPTEVFSQALQTALAASARRAGTNSNAEASSSNDQPRDNSRPPPEFLEPMQLMREMGINDDAMSVEALRATNGDVQAAINLIFAQWMAED